MKQKREEKLDEFKFNYQLDDRVQTSDKYFMAHNLDEAVKMFEYVCEKRRLNAHVTKIEKWNRWNNTRRSVRDNPTPDHN